MSIGPTLSRAPHRELRVTCPEGSRLAVGHRPSPREAVVPVVEATAWSRGLWGTFLPERRQRPADPPQGQPERRRAA